MGFSAIYVCMSQLVLNFLRRSVLFFGGLSLVLAILISIFLFGGWWYPIFSLPTLILLAISLISLATSRVFEYQELQFSKPLALYISPFCAGSLVVFSSFIIWKNHNSPDQYAALETSVLLFSGLSVYLIIALFLKNSTALLFLFLGFFFVSFCQLYVVFAQLSSQFAFHPMAELALWFKLPAGISPNQSSYVSGSFFSKGTLGSLLMFSFLFSLSLSIWSRLYTWLKILLFFFSMLCLLGAGLSMSRSVYLGTFVGTLVFIVISFFICYRYSVINKIVFFSFFILLFLILFSIPFILSNSNYNFYTRVISFSDDPYRLFLWFDLTPRLLRIDPWFGIGGNFFDTMSIRYRDSSLGARPIHAHNDWLQLLIEYGWVGFILGVFSYIVHLFVGLRSLFSACYNLYSYTVVPVSIKIAALIASLSCLCAFGVVAFFDYQMHFTTFVILFSICGGILCSSVVHSGDLDPFSHCVNSSYSYINRVGPAFYQKWRFVLINLLTLCFCVCFGLYVLYTSVPRILPEYYVLSSENNLVKGDYDKAWADVQVGLSYQPDNPRLLILAGEVLGQKANLASVPQERDRLYDLCAYYWLRAVVYKPFFAYAIREAGMALDWAGEPCKALSLHKRAIGLDPGFAMGYEALALHYMLLNQHSKSLSLFKLSQRLPGSTLAATYIPILEHKLTISSP